MEEENKNKIQSAEDQPDHPEDQIMEEIRVLLPETMGVSGDGALVVKESLGLGSVLLLEEGQVRAVQVKKKKMEEIKEEVFAGNEVRKQLKNSKEDSFWDLCTWNNSLLQ
jgi:hypothetical protein